MLDPIFVAAIPPLATYVLPIFGSAAVALYAIFRLNSTLIIREKIWNFWIGDGDFSDEKLRSFSHNQLDLAHFRMAYGVPARSIIDLHRLLSWIKRHKLTPIEIKKIRRWIDPAMNEVLKIPSNEYFLARIVMVLFLILIVLGLMSAATFKEAAFKMNQSGTWFSSDGESVNSVWGKWRIDSQSCKLGTLPTPENTGLTRTETTAVCNAIVDGELKSMVRAPLKGQRQGFTSVAFLGFLFQLVIIFKIHVAAKARKLADRLHSGKVERTNYRSFRKK